MRVVLPGEGSQDSIEGCRQVVLSKLRGSICHNCVFFLVPRVECVNSITMLSQSLLSVFITAAKRVVLSVCRLKGLCMSQIELNKIRWENEQWLKTTPITHFVGT